MRHARPCQHWRHMKDGRKIPINPEVRKPTKTVMKKRRRLTDEEFERLQQYHREGRQKVFSDDTETLEDRALREKKDMQELIKKRGFDDYDYN